jgi:hypothetical protein
MTGFRDQIVKGCHGIRSEVSVLALTVRNSCSLPNFLVLTFMNCYPPIYCTRRSKERSRTAFVTGVYEYLDLEHAKARAMEIM